MHFSYNITICGAYGISVKKIQDLIDRFDIVNALEDFKPRWNVRPGKENPVIVNHGNNKIEYMLWGLLPHFAKDKDYKNRPINAKAETFDKLPTFHHSFHTKRCLVPATGFYEPDKIHFSKNPFPWHYFQMKIAQYLPLLDYTILGRTKTMEMKFIAIQS